ncbi:MAG: redoxin domain-containing protein [Chloroflexi bacterium]|nr:redoxin domain-containing protein [Chloroflexota bacterium]
MNARPARRRRASLLWGGLILAVAALLLMLVLVPLGRTNTAARSRLLDRPAPAIGLLDLAGRRWTLSESRGRLVWVNFWATWCPPCRTEMPMMQRLADAYGDRLLILGVDFGEEPSAVRQFVDRYGIGYPILLDPTLDTFYRWSPQFGLPRHYFVDARGTVIREIPGELPPDQMVALFDELLGPPPQSQ